MPKMKSVKGASKRFKLTASGRLKREHANRSHILTKKSPKRLRNLRKSGIVGSEDESRIKRMLGMN